MLFIIKKITLEVSANIILLMVVCVLIFHTLVLLGVIPFETVWGGRLENVSQMYLFETISIVVNLIIISVVGMKVGYIKRYLNEKIINTILWFLVVLFVLNTIGNIISLSLVESLIFTPLTFISALLFYRMATGKRKDRHEYNNKLHKG